MDPTPGATARLEAVRAALRGAAERAGRNLEDVRLVAVGKTFPAESLRPVYDAGQRDFGENRVPEAAQKTPQLPDDICWHLIGHLQSNKAAEAVRVFDVIHSVDSLKLALRLERLAGEQGRRPQALLQVDLAGEQQKFGIEPDDLPGILEAAAGFRHLPVVGLMVLPPYAPDPENVRPFYRRLRQLAESMESRGLLGKQGPVQLSMGMSNDFEVAVEEGATLVRVGTALFGPRKTAGAPARND